MKKISFTLMEVLIAMAIIGIIAGATANSIKNISANRTKIEFRNCYNHMTRTLDDLHSDKMLFPAKVNMCTLDHDSFVKAFFDLTAGAIKKTDLGTGYAFTTKQGSYWVVRRNPNVNTCYIVDVDDISKADYWIVFDINGLEKGPNCPYDGDDLGTDGGPFKFCSEAVDTFKFGITVNGKILPDTTHTYKGGGNLTEYIEENNLLKDNF